MSALAFDTHRIVKRLKEAGFSDAQAEAVTDALGESRTPTVDISLLVTKADLRAELATLATKAELAPLATKAELAPLATKAELATLATKAELADAKYDIIKWVIGAIGLQTLAIVSAIVALAKVL